MQHRIDARGHHTEHRVAHAGKVVVIDDIAGADQLDAGLIEPALRELLGERARLPGRHEHEQRVRIEIARPLQEWREIRIGERHLDRVQDLPARLREVVGEYGGGFGARRPIGLDDDHFLAAILGRPLANDAGLLAEREAGAHHVGVVGIDHAGGARDHHHVGDLALRGERPDRHGAGGEP